MNNIKQSKQLIESYQLNEYLGAIVKSGLKTVGSKIAAKYAAKKAAKAAAKELAKSLPKKTIAQKGKSVAKFVGGQVALTAALEPATYNPKTYKDMVKKSIENPGRLKFGERLVRDAALNSSDKKLPFSHKLIKDALDKNKRDLSNKLDNQITKNNVKITDPKLAERLRQINS